MKSTVIGEVISLREDWRVPQRHGLNVQPKIDGRLLDRLSGAVKLDLQSPGPVEPIATAGQGRAAPGRGVDGRRPDIV